MGHLTMQKPYLALQERLHKNPVGAPHTFTTVYWVDNGDGLDTDGQMGNFDRAQGADITVTLADQGGAVSVPSGPFTRTVTSPDPGAPGSGTSCASRPKAGWSFRIACIFG